MVLGMLAWATHTAVIFYHLMHGNLLFPLLTTF